MNIEEYKYVIKIEFTDGCSYYTGKYSYHDNPKDGARYKTKSSTLKDVNKQKNCFVDEVKIYPSLLKTEVNKFNQLTPTK